MPRAAWRTTALGGEYALLFNGIEVDRFAKAAEPWPTDGADRSSSSVATSPARASTCCSTRCRSSPADVATLGRAATGPRPPRCRRVARATRGSSGSAGSATTRRRAAARRRRVLRAVAARRVVRRRAARGDGGADTGRGQRPRRLRNVARAGADALLVPPGDARRPRRSARARCSTNPTCAEATRRPRASSGPRSSRWTTSPTVTSSSTSEL